MALGSSSNADGLRTVERRGANQALADQATANTPGDISGAVAAHVAASDPHGDRAYTDSELSDHVAAGDPHTGYVLEGGTLTDTTALDALTFTATPTQAEVEALRDEVSALLAALRVHD